MARVSKNRWNLLSEDGHTMVEDIPCYSRQMAIEWVEAYISSWPSWSYRIEE